MMYETEEACYVEPEEFFSASFVPAVDPQYFELLKREKENAGLTDVDITLMLPESTKDRFSPTTCQLTGSNSKKYYIIINPQRLTENGKSPGVAIREKLNLIKDEYLFSSER